ncbi:MAG: hypothetical protein M1117_05255 [Candidatus Thermoplasmatota archaeon]|uniref:Uncharacterized protein n=1 Tax=Candidatus Sysuiplasma superficiale TaxID=2823368 RepID=A0A8J7YLK8_9ARCH|nr:hypothetical protein [Candidatus Sysuiplasma superficiale]MCL4347304.1 hypothetical protein [Candidatus Thermoplasmatota archaeon]
MRTRYLAITAAILVSLALLFVAIRNYAASLGAALGTVAVVIALFGCCAIPLILSLFVNKNRNGEK